MREPERVPDTGSPPERGEPPKLRLGGSRRWSLKDVQAWADQHGGELAVRNAAAEGAFSPFEDRAVQKWLELEERKRVLARDEATLLADQRAARAAERAARWAMWSAIVSAATAIASALWAVFGADLAAWLSRPPQ